MSEPKHIMRIFYGVTRMLLTVYMDDCYYVFKDIPEGLWWKIQKLHDRSLQEFDPTKIHGKIWQLLKGAQYQKHKYKPKEED